MLKLHLFFRLMFVQLVKRTSFIESEENEGEQKEEEMFDSSFLAEMYEVTFVASFFILFGFNLCKIFRVDISLLDKLSCTY